MKKLLKILIILLLLLFCFKNWIYRTTINYTPIKERKTIELKDKKLITKLKEEIENKEITPTKIVQIASDITNQTLQFTFQKASIDPNKLVQTRKANCVGYSAMFNAVANYIITQSDLEHQLEVKHLVGKLDFFGVDLHQFFSAPFYKDHDYNVIENKTTGAIILIDPSINDYLRIGTKTQD